MYFVFALERAARGHRRSDAFRIGATDSLKLLLYPVHSSSVSLCALTTVSELRQASHDRFIPLKVKATHKLFCRDVILGVCARAGHNAHAYYDISVGNSFIHRLTREPVRLALKTKY